MKFLLVIGLVLALVFVGCTRNTQNNLPAANNSVSQVQTSSGSQQPAAQDNIVGCWFRESKYGFDPTDYIKFDNGSVGVNHATPMTWERTSAEFVTINVEGHPISVYQIDTQPDLFKYGGIDTYKRGDCSQIRIQ